VGAGERAHWHVAAARQASGIQIAGVADLDPHRLADLGHKCGIDRLYPDVASMLEDEEIDLLDIVTPPWVRLAVVQEAWKRGIRRFLIEKPVALTRSELEKLRDLSKEGLIVVNTQYRWMPHWARLLTLLAKGELGEIKLIACTTREDVMDQGTHVLDLAVLAMNLTGLRSPKLLSVSNKAFLDYGPSRVPADLAAVFRCEGAYLVCEHGPSAPSVPGEDLARSWAHIQMQIVGTKGTIWVSLDQGWELKTDTTHETGQTVFRRDDILAQAAMLTELDAAIASQRAHAFPTSIEKAADSMDMILKMCELAAIERPRSVTHA
jgi:predicted dehydrogenase